MRATVTADLHVDVDVDDGRTVHAHLTGHGSRLELRVDDPSAFAGRGDAAMIAALAETLFRQDVVVTVVNDSERLVSLGAVRAPWWQARLTGSRRIRLGSWRGALTSARARLRGGRSLLPDVSMVPPTTPWPPTPTFGGRRRAPSTTHDPARRGGARLVLVRQDSWAGERQPIFWLGETTSIGSDPGCDVVLRGLEPRQVTVVHDARDEYVVRVLAGSATVHGQPADGRILRTGARLDLGSHHLVFAREEFADHGRPHGGRIGGERGHQREQAPRRS